MFFRGIPSQIYLATGSTDMRKSINGLSILVADQLEHDPLSASFFVSVTGSAQLLKYCTGIVTVSASGIKGWRRIVSSGRNQKKRWFLWRDVSCSGC